MFVKHLAVAALVFAASPAFAQSLTGGVVVSESPVRTQPLSLGGTGSLAIVTPEQAGSLTSDAPRLDLLPADEQQVLDSLPRITPAMAGTLRVDEPGAANAAAAPLEDDVEVFVVEDGTILPAGSWNAQQSAACKASGGVELPLPADRIGCFKL